jgi:four helix bundle protein
MDIAIASTNEVQSMLYLGLDRKYIDEKKLEMALVQTTETMNLVYGFRRHLEKDIP